MDLFAAFGLPVLVGVFIGILSGLLGIGGGTIMVPVFRLAFGLSPLMSTATSLFTIIPTSISGAVSHIKGKTCVPALGLAMGLGGALTSPVGVWLASLSPAWLVMLAAALIIGYSAVNMLRKAVKAPSKCDSSGPSAATPGDSGDRRSAAQPSASCAALLRSEDKIISAQTTPSSPGAAAEGVGTGNHDGTAPAVPRLSRKQLLIGAAIGLGAGLMSGYVGVGGGFIMVPLMLSLIHIPMKLASGTSLIAILILAIPGTIENGIAGNIDYVVGLSVAIGSIPGAVLGAMLVKRVPERALRFIFGGFLIIAAIVLFLNEFGILG
ncbi:MAG TPA: sulfite exporter TauE/SafE family protein [Candidatus Aphodovivens avicola]|nr:sulfite exporter TauE/SafE family protein [Candidatus Aphodovivens avicola]